MLVLLPTWTLLLPLLKGQFLKGTARKVRCEKKKEMYSPVSGGKMSLTLCIAFPPPNALGTLVASHDEPPNIYLQHGKC